MSTNDWVIFGAVTMPASALMPTCARQSKLRIMSGE
jgi:hypothetical protein